jgi:hypothetical protein
VPKKKKIKKTLIPPNSLSRIKATKLSQPQGISFSFKYLDLDRPKFNSNGKDGGYWQTLMARLKDLSALTALELLRNRHRSLRCHPIDWKDTSEEGFGIPNEEQLVDTPYQFSLSSNEHGRVHGFFIDEVFYVVWLDPNHLLYPGK